MTAPANQPVPAVQVARRIGDPGTAPAELSGLLSEMCEGAPVPAGWAAAMLEAGRPIAELDQVVAQLHAAAADSVAALRFAATVQQLHGDQVAARTLSDRGPQAADDPQAQVALGGNLTSAAGWSTRWICSPRGCWWIRTTRPRWPATPRRCRRHRGTSGSHRPTARSDPARPTRPAAHPGRRLWPTLRVARGWTKVGTRFGSSWQARRTGRLPSGW